jgi:DNA-binding CsgD family transcriptional regulator
LNFWTARGWNDERIARQLDITATTVAVHRKHIRQKLELHNDRELVAYAREWGLDEAIATDDATGGTESGGRQFC